MGGVSRGRISLCHGAMAKGCIRRFFSMNVMGPRWPPISVVQSSTQSEEIRHADVPATTEGVIGGIYNTAGTARYKKKAHGPILFWARGTVVRPGGGRQRLRGCVANGGWGPVPGAAIMG